MRIKLINVLLSAIALSCFLSGCAWHRTVYNAKSRDLDISFIEPGETTWQEVIRKLGPPDIPIKDLRSFHYTTGDARKTEFRITYFVFLPFEWTDRQEVVDTLIEFDRRGTVTGAYQTTRSTIRPPYEGEGAREFEPIVGARRKS